MDKLMNSLHIDQQQNIHDVAFCSDLNLTKTNKKWMYLFSNNITFKRSVKNAIKINRPADSCLKTWLEKVIVAEQCSHVFVENFNVYSIDGKYITDLCQLHDVTLVNLQIGESLSNNVVRGPWH